MCSYRRLWGKMCNKVQENKNTEDVIIVDSLKINFLKMAAMPVPLLFSKMKYYCNCLQCQVKLQELNLLLTWRELVWTLGVVLLTIYQGVHITYFTQKKSIDHDEYTVTI